jgi:hypothetical protein
MTTLATLLAPRRRAPGGTRAGVLDIPSAVREDVHPMAALGAEAWVCLGSQGDGQGAGGSGVVGTGGTGIGLRLAANDALAAAFDEEESAAPARAWIARLEHALDRLLPSPIGTLLQLFVCVSLTMAMMSAMLPLLDRI